MYVVTIHGSTGSKAKGHRAADGNDEVIRSDKGEGNFYGATFVAITVNVTVVSSQLHIIKQLLGNMIRDDCDAFRSLWQVFAWRIIKPWLVNRVREDKRRYL